MNTITVISPYLMHIRKVKNLKQRMVCKDIGISQNYLSQIENSVKLPSIDILNKLLLYY